MPILLAAIGGDEAVVAVAASFAPVWLAGSLRLPPSLGPPGDRHGNARSRHTFAADALRAAARLWSVFSSEAISIPGEAVQALPITVDPPAHGPYRSILASLFSPTRIRAMESEARHLAAVFVDRFIERGSCDVSAELSQPLPTIMLARLIGVPADREDEFAGWTDTLIYHLPGDPRPGLEASRALRDYFMDLVDAAGGDGPPGTLLQVAGAFQEDGRRLCAGEILSLWRLCRPEIHGMPYGILAA